MRRRDFLALLGGAAATSPLGARAQPPSTPRRIAIFHPAIPVALLTETGGGTAWRAFFAELRRLGYLEGQNLIIERYSAEGHHERYAEFAREIVTRNPDLIVTGTNPVVIAFRAATSTIPLVALNRNYPRCRDRDLGEALSDTERSHPFNSQGGISRDARGLGRYFWASLAGCQRPIGNFADFHAPAAGHSLGD